MKEIIAIIRPKQWQKTKARLLEEGFNAFTVHRVYGRGRQKGLQYLSKSREVIEGIRFLPKRMVTLFVPEEDVEKAARIIVETNRTGEIGALALPELARDDEGVRTGEKGQEALV